jgi:HlyD family secretion protein
VLKKVKLTYNCPQQSESKQKSAKVGTVNQKRVNSDKPHSDNIEQTEVLSDALSFDRAPWNDSNRARSLLSKKGDLLIGVGMGALLTAGGTQLLNSSPKESVSAAETIAKSNTASASAQSVTATEVKAANLDRTLKANGTVAAFELVPVTSQGTGLQIKQVLVERGQTVKAGQMLALLDDSRLKAELLQARGAFAKAQAKLAELKAGTRREEIARSRERVADRQAALWQAESDLELTQKRVQRNRTLQAEGAIALDRLDEILTEDKSKRSLLQQAQANLEEARQELAQLEAGPTPEVMAQAEAELAEAEGKVQLVRAQLKDTIVTAPTNGKIAERNASIGDLVSTSEKLFTIIENGRLELRLTVPETQLSQIRSGQKVRIAGNTTSNFSLVGTIRSIDPMVKEDSRQATVKVDLPSHSALKPGMFLQGSIVTATTKGASVPLDALLPQTDGSAIAYVLQKDNTVKAQQVTMGDIVSAEKAEVIEGLNPGDRIVLKGAAYLRDGDRVEVK